MRTLNLVEDQPLLAGSVINHTPSSSRLNIVSYTAAEATDITFE